MDGKRSSIGLNQSGAVVVPTQTPQNVATTPPDDSGFFGNNKVALAPQWKNGVNPRQLKDLIPHVPKPATPASNASVSTSAGESVKEKLHGLKWVKSKLHEFKIALSQTRRRFVAWRKGQAEKKAQRTDQTTSVAKTPPKQSWLKSDAGQRILATDDVGARKINSAKELAERRNADWRDNVRKPVRAELLALPNVAAAKARIEEVATLAEKLNDSEYTELAKIYSSLEKDVCNVEAMSRAARTNFSAEVDDQLKRHLNDFFRGDLQTTTAYGPIARNWNAETNANARKIMADIFSENSELVQKFEGLQGNEKLTASQMDASLTLAALFLEKAFGEGDQGISFDGRVIEFLKDTSEEIASKDEFLDGTKVTPDVRNDAIRKWFGDGIALRGVVAGFLPILASDAPDRAAYAYVAQAITRAFVNVPDLKGKNDDPEVAKIYSTFINEWGPKAGDILVKLGMPTADDKGKAKVVD